MKKKSSIYEPIYINLFYFITRRRSQTAQVNRAKNVVAPTVGSVSIARILNDVVCTDCMALEDHLHCKCLPDGSKRIRIPHLFNPQPNDEKRKRILKRHCTVHIN